MTGTEDDQHPASDDDYWRQKFVDAINSDMERDDDWGRQVRCAVKKVTGQEGPIA